MLTSVEMMSLALPERKSGERDLVRENGGRNETREPIRSGRTWCCVYRLGSPMRITVVLFALVSGLKRLDLAVLFVFFIRAQASRKVESVLVRVDERSDNAPDRVRTFPSDTVSAQPLSN